MWTASLQLEKDGGDSTRQSWMESCGLWPMSSLGSTRHTVSQWLKCNGTQGNAVLHLQFMDQTVPPPQIVTVLENGTRPMTERGTNSNVQFT